MKHLKCHSTSGYKDKQERKNIKIEGEEVPKEPPSDLKEGVVTIQFRTPPTMNIITRRFLVDNSVSDVLGYIIPVQNGSKTRIS